MNSHSKNETPSGPSADPKGDSILLKAAQKVADAKREEKAAKHEVEAKREASATKLKEAHDLEVETAKNAHRIEVILPKYDPDDLNQHAAM